MSAVAESYMQNDEEIKHLLRRVVYMFYPHQSIIILEALLFHNVLFEDDLIKLCCMHKKVFRSFCNKLIDDKIITQHVQKEESTTTNTYTHNNYGNNNGNNGNNNFNNFNKLFTRTYYYVHNIEAIDAIKWKIHSIVKQVKEEIGNFSEPQGYICPTCHTKFSLLDAASLLTDDKLNFECSICSDYLIDDDISQEQKKGQEKLEQLMSLVEPIIHYLKVIDDLKIEDNNFESTLIKYVPAFSDSIALYSVSNKSNNLKRKKADNEDINVANKKSQATIHVSITADDEDLKRERQKREERNEKLRQNALPSWHQESTVGKVALGKLEFEEENPVSLDNTEDTNINVKIEGDVPTVPTAISEEIQIKDATDKSLPGTSDISLTSHSNLSSIPNTEITPSIPQKSVAGSFVRSSINTTNDNSTTEELDALSAYYSQLRQRQAEEEEEEEEDDEDELGVEETPEDSVDVNTDASDKTPTPDIETVTSKNELQSNESHPVESEKVDMDVDEDDFDLDMFESDDE